MEQLSTIAHVGYLVSITLFIFGIKRLSKVRTARSGNTLASCGMLLAIICQLLELGELNYAYILGGVAIGSLVGVVLAFTVAMTAMPQLVAIFNGFGGAASLLVGLSLFYAAPQGDGYLKDLVLGSSQGVGTAFTLVLSVVIGALTFSGSIFAYLKLSERFGNVFGKPILLPLRHVLSFVLVASVLALGGAWIFGGLPLTMNELAMIITVVSLLLGVAVVLPIGGADMPVVVSLLNSYSGLAASAAGFSLGANALIVSGALVGASGLILTHVMCKGMNRTLLHVMIGGFGGAEVGEQNNEYENVRHVDSEEAALDFEVARDVIIVPGYGLAVAQGQNAIGELADHLKRLGAKVRYAVHPVAGRMPGHMNVLLAESNIPYDELFEMDEINRDFQGADIALVVGANDVVNPSAKTDAGSPLYGMPILDVENASMVYVIKRSLSPGFAGVKNELFERDNCRMIFGDAKRVLEEISGHLED